MKIINHKWINEEIASLPFILVDLETTGFTPQTAGVTEIAAIKMVGGVETESFHTLLDPGRPIPSEITNLTGITEQMVMGKPTLKSLVPKLESLFHGCIFVSHNVPFDWAFIDHAFQDQLRRRLAMPSLCTLHLSRKLLGLRSNKLSSVASHFGVSLKSAHRAMGDIMALKSILAGLIEHLSSSGFRTALDLVDKGFIC